MYHFDWIKRHAERTPEKLALVDAHSGQKWTYAQLNGRANQFATFLRDKLGVQQGDRVSLLAQNSGDYYVILFACAKIGAILNTLNWRLTAPELEYILNDCTPHTLIYDSEFAGAVDTLRPSITVENYVCLGNSVPDGDWTYENALDAGSPADFEGPRLRYEDTWAILYTSGTTGRPKGAQVTYGNFFYNAVGMGQAIDLHAADINLNVLPTFHAGGLGLYAGPIFHSGGTLIVMRAFNPGEMLHLIQEWRVTKLLLVPAIYLALLQFPDFDQYDISSVVHWGSGGSALPTSLVQSYAEKGIIVQQGFGMTETGPTVFMID
ncbi:MAG: AMP-binding protein, partial [Anaerolineales bacterium]|nr:AMP-binding protein [Anaerolineales bacterium]